MWVDPWTTSTVQRLITMVSAAGWVHDVIDSDHPTKQLPGSVKLADDPVALIAWHHRLVQDRYQSRGSSTSVTPRVLIVGERHDLGGNTEGGRQLSTIARVGRIARVHLAVDIAMAADIYALPTEFRDNVSAVFRGYPNTWS